MFCCKQEFSSVYCLFFYHSFFHLPNILSISFHSQILHDFLFLFFESYIFHLGVSSLPWLTRARDGRGRGNVSLRRGWYQS
ncbi:hypothetical protein BRARA_I04524 [Brassica rapa]|uniref:Uncharacterized protein n=1 Tax=Brassica campestris TaxID=3711 RepID=A0A397Y2X4_BRACM|nr:hypothetical protein BRARA_I04524 [Brassica rapa]